MARGAPDLSVSELRARLGEIMAQHVGRESAVGMGELYQQVYGQPWRHRINDTRALRYLITDARRRGVPILSTRSTVGGGYYLPSVGSERRRAADKLEAEALRKLYLASVLRKVGLAERFGQLSLKLRPGGSAGAANEPA